MNLSRRLPIYYEAQKTGVRRLFESISQLEEGKGLEKDLSE